MQDDPRRRLWPRETSAKVRRLLPPLACAMLVASCASNASPATLRDAGHDGSEEPTWDADAVGSEAATDGGSPSVDAQDAGPVDETTRPKLGEPGASLAMFGRLSFSLSDRFNVSLSSRISAREGYFALGDPSETCHFSVHNDQCLLERCAPASSTAPLTKVPHAGTLTITNVTQGKSAFVTPDERGSYSAILDSDFTLKPGETLSLRAEGADIPAFSTLLEAPFPLSVQSPSAGASFSKQDGFSFAWSTDAAVTRLDLSDTSFAPTLMCEWENRAKPSGQAAVGSGHLDFLSCPVGVYVIPMSETLRWVRAGDYLVQVALMHAPPKVMKLSCVAAP